MRSNLEEKINFLSFNSKNNRFRSIILLIGSDAKKNIPYIHYMWSKSSTEINNSVLWCYSNNFSKNLLSMKKVINPSYYEPENFFSLVKVRYCYYNEIDKVLGNTFGMCVLENFEALSPNIMAKTIETVEGGGLIIFLLNTINSLDKIHSVSMEIYKKFESESYKTITGRFIERFVFSLNSCSTFIAIDENLKIISTHSKKNFEMLSKNLCKNLEYNKEAFFLLIKSVKNLEPLSSLIEKTRTFDQARALLTFTEAISNKSLLSTVILTAARGRGKSAVLGLATAAAVAYGYGNIYITAPNPENLNTYFAFVFIGLKILNYEENKHFEIIQDSKLKFIAKIEIFCTHRQSITFLFPNEIEEVKKDIELLIIDEAASIPIPILESICGSFVIFMSTTTSGYEGTGKYFTLKFIKNIKTKLQNKANSKKKILIIQEVSLNEPIRYSFQDPVEKWLNEFLCLDNDLPPILLSGCPDPMYCKLFLVDRNALFSSHKIANRFLQKIFSLLISVHYKNSPDDLQMICDAPSHRILILVTPLPLSIAVLPDVLGVLHISYEGQIAHKFVEKNLTKNIKINGDLIPWVISKEFLDSSFAELSGVRIIRLAIHPDIQSMGYGSKLLKNLVWFFQSIFKQNILENGRCLSDKNFKNSFLEKISPMLINLENRNPPRLDYIGVSFGLTQQLFYFWKKNGFKVIFIRSQKNKITGEHVCIMLYPITKEIELIPNWIKNYQFDFLTKFLGTINWKFNKMNAILVFSIVQNVHFQYFNQSVYVKHVKKIFSNTDIYKIFFYIENSAFEYKTLAELFPVVAKIVIWNELTKNIFFLSEILLLISIGLQHKSLGDLIIEFNYKNEDIISLSREIFRKFIYFYFK
nr:N-acetyltransferase 10 [Cryptomonas curvata]